MTHLLSMIALMNSKSVKESIMNNRWKKSKAHKRSHVQQEVVRQQKSIHKFYKKIKIKIVENPVILALESYINLHPQLSIRPINDEKFLLRITINYIRHCLSNYEYLIQQVSHLKCNYQEFKQLVNQIIMNKYADKLISIHSGCTLAISSNSY